MVQQYEDSTINRTQPLSSSVDREKNQGVAITEESPSQERQMAASPAERKMKLRLSKGKSRPAMDFGPENTAKGHKPSFSSSPSGVEHLDRPATSHSSGSGTGPLPSAQMPRRKRQRSGSLVMKSGLLPQAS
ncbi:unnamed protein product [Gadus morhua 'NCC']